MRICQSDAREYPLVAGAFAVRAARAPDGVDILAASIRDIFARHGSGTVTRLWPLAGFVYICQANDKAMQEIRALPEVAEVRQFRRAGTVTIEI